ncbi:unnamed protein product [Bursaphelenchus xylophilus]|nr:unnamed protein product [Bursaphelenchus xylophilus]CAG9094161.1 unnamed protein product [Bursaphelenchus xylophilus]
MNGSRIAVHLMIEWTADIRPRYLLNVTCVALATIHMIALMLTALCMNMLAVEQHLATIWVNDYEEKSIKVGVILMMIVVVQCVPFGVFINWWYLSDDYDLNNSVESCIPVDHHWELALMGFALCFITCSLCSAWLILLHRYNRRKMLNRLSLESLSARYQQTANVDSNQSIVPSLIGYMILSLIGLLLSFLRGKFAREYGEYNPYGKITTDMGYCSVDMYALYHMFCFMFYNEAMRHVVRRDLRTIFCCLHSVDPCEFVAKTAPGQEGDTYFNNLLSSWNTA